MISEGIENIQLAKIGLILGAKFKADTLFRNSL